MSAHLTDGRPSGAGSGIANRTGLRSRRLRALVAGLFVLCELLRAGTALAQGARSSIDDIDLEPPLIEHEQILEADASYRQRFFAQVVDDRQLASVTLHWRFAGESDYAKVAMNRVSTSSTWIGEVSTSPSDSRAIEYFLEARDNGGNRTVRGFVFSPLVRRIVNPNEPPGDPATASVATTEDAPAVGRSRTVYYVLGALAIGVLAGLASGRSSGSGGDDDCGGDGCEVVIRFDTPVTQ